MTWLCVVAYPWGEGGVNGKEDPLKLDWLMECFKISLFAGRGVTEAMPVFWRKLGEYCTV